MITRHFLCKEHESFGTKGLVLRGSTNFDPFDGMGCAHDMLEHFPNDSGHIHEEYMALGASIFIRSEGGYFSNRMHSIEENMTGDITFIVYHAQEYNKTIIPYIKKPRKPVEFDHFSVDAYRAAAYAHIDSEFPETEYYDLISTPEKIQFFIEHSIKWMRQGYAQAKRRYKGCDSYSLTSVFKLVEETINKALRNMEYGDEITVSVDPRGYYIKTKINGVSDY